ncbi:MAG: 1-deoxy-D-xylulose-5-phosphate reductoisomerase [Oscillospiraceae bacterium]|jgi:1-deoxy-D-xylulose-5-phosphate reductoisomerase|nr:1-deoxy-D-xylulose-5-phosphate reductoisomerase [Oscillospiraceae bacterium]
MEIVLLGSSGSIGSQTLDVARRHKILIKGLAVKSSVQTLELQAREFNPHCVCVYDENYYTDLKTRLADTKIEVLCGNEGMCKLAAMSCDMVVNAVVGMAGLEPTLAAIEAGNKIALANKETLAAGGELVMKCAKEKMLEIIPIDSEHSAIFQCLEGNNRKDAVKLILTASGGAFYGYSKERLRTVTKQEALHNPNWSMGAKVTVDSATLMNKGLEFIEAVRLFGMKPEQIEVVVHRQSIIHSAVEFADGSVIAQLGVPDMHVPIQYALLHPARPESGVKRLSFTEMDTLTFEKPDEETFTCLPAAKKAVNMGNNACAVLNAANEAAVEAFLEDKIEFFMISELVNDALENVKSNRSVTLKTIFEDSNAAMEYVRSKL